MNLIKRLSRMVPAWALIVLGIIAALLALNENRLFVRAIAC